MLAVIALSFKCLHKKAKCLMKVFIYEVDFTLNVLNTYQEYYDLKDFNRSVEVNSMEEWEMIGVEQMTTHFELEQMIVNYRQFSEHLQKKIDNCKLSVRKLESLCKRLFPTEGCEVIDGVVVAKKCPKDYFSVDLVFCVPVCPSSYSDDVSNPFICKKNHEAARSSDLHESFKTPDITYRGHSGFYECPQNYKNLLLDICIRECPIGWVDLGQDCEKPSLIRRDNELFIYKFELDDDE